MKAAEGKDRVFILAAPGDSGRNFIALESPSPLEGEGRGEGEELQFHETIKDIEQRLDDPAGQHSIRVNDRFRVCFVWTTEGPKGVEIVDYH